MQNVPRIPKCTPLFSRDEWLERYALLSGGVTDFSAIECNSVQFWAISGHGPPYDVEAYVGKEVLRPSKLTPMLDKA